MQRLQDLLLEHHCYVKQFRHTYEVLADQLTSTIAKASSLTQNRLHHSI
jgi:hypothetical protein